LGISVLLPLLIGRALVSVCGPASLYGSPPVSGGRSLITQLLRRLGCALMGEGRPTMRLGSPV
jgi:hypothetical protein